MDDHPQAVQTTQQVTDKFTLERLVCLFAAISIVAVVCFLILRNAPFADPNLVVLARIILALAVGILGGTIPGFLSLEYNLVGFTVRAGGALGLFVIAFFGTPHVEPLHLVDTFNLQSEIRQHLGNANNCATALRESQDLLKLAPNEPIAHNLNGYAHYCLGHISEALTAFNSAIALDANFRSAKFNKAAALIRLGKYAEAEAILQPLVAADPGYTSARYNLAVAQANLQKFSEARKNLQSVYSQDRSFDSALGLGFLYLLDESNLSEQNSLTYFKIAIGMKPELVCFLHAKVPIDPELEEEKPFVDLAHLAERKAAFAGIRTNFDAKFADAVCQGS